MPATTQHHWMKVELLGGSCSLSASSSVNRSNSRAGGRRSSSEAALPFLTKRENVEPLPNVWWQAVARKSGSLGTQRPATKARGGRSDGEVNFRRRICVSAFSLNAITVALMFTVIPFPTNVNIRNVGCCIV